MTGNVQMTDSGSQSFSWLYGVILGWALGLFTLPIAKDSDSKGKCLNRLYELKRLLEKLSKNMRSPTRSEARYYEYLMETKLLLENLDIQSSELIFKPYDLNKLLSQSFVIFQQFDPEHENPAYHTTQTAVRVMMI